MKRKGIILSLIVILSLALIACGEEKANKGEKEEGSIIEIGCMPLTEPIIEIMNEELKEYEIIPKVFDGNHLPATALSEGDVDGVVLNHKDWMDTFNSENGTNLIMPEPYMYYSRNAVYSSKYDNLEDIPNGGTIAVPGDPTNLSDSLELLDELGFIKLGEKTGEFFNKLSIEKNIKDIEILETEITATARSIDDVDAIICRGSLINEIGRDPQDFLYEDKSVIDIPLGLIIDGDSQEEDWVKKFLNTTQEEGFRNKFKDRYRGTFVLYE